MTCHYRSHSLQLQSAGGKAGNRSEALRFQRSAAETIKPDATIDTGKLARLNVSGHGICNIAINAAFRTADLGEPVSMAHLLHTAHFEASKRESPLSAAETRGWVPI